MMATLRLPGLEVIDLKPHCDLVLGRRDARDSEGREHISRRQVRLVHDGATLRVQGLGGANPTKVVRRGGKRSRVLPAGGQVALGPGDSVLLLASDPGSAIQVESIQGVQECSPQVESAQGVQECSPQVESAQGVEEGAPQMAGGAPAAAGGDSAGAAGVAMAGGSTAAAAGGGTAPPAAAGRDGTQPAAQAAPPVLLLLSGVQGSGKSTFAGQLAAQSALPWRRVNQDSIAGASRKGTRQQCVAAAQEALAAGQCVVVDRTNVDAAQRAPFVAAAARAGAAAHCVALHLPQRLCGERAAARQAHEGGVEGPRAHAIVGATSKALQAAGPPSAQEGLASVMVCTSDADVAAALQAWAGYGAAGGADPEAEWRRLRPAAGGGRGGGPMDRFLAGRDGAGRAGGGGGGSSTGGAGGSAGRAAERAAPAAAGLERPAPAPAPPAPAPAPPAADALQQLMAGAREQARQAAAPAPPRRRAAPPAPSSRHAFSGSPFAGALAAIAANPESRRAEGEAAGAFHVDDQCVLVPDKFPKARRHALVIARCPGLGGPLDLAPEHAPLVAHMKEVGGAWAAAQAAADPGLPPFMLGFHSVPSLRRLHLHVLSSDLDSPPMKHKKHFLSFATQFFIPVDEVLRVLQAGGRLQYQPAQREALLRGALRCHRCGAGAPNMPRLKEHLAACGG